MQRAGLVPFYLSINNSAAGIAHLIKATNCQAVLVGPPGNSVSVDKNVQEALGLLKQDGFGDLQIVQWPHDHVSTQGADLDASLPILPSDLDRPALIMHSSGTSSLYPKPIVETERAVREYMHAPHYSDAALYGQVLFVGHLPPAHALPVTLTHVAASGKIVGFMGPRNPPLPMTPERLLKVLPAFDGCRTVVPPSLIEAILRDEQLHEPFSRLRRFWYGGSTMPSGVAEECLKLGVRPYSLLGSTEIACPTKLFAESELLAWDVVTLSKQTRLKWRPVEGEPGFYEMLAAPNLPYHKPMVLNDTYEGEPVFATGDRCQMIDALEGEKWIRVLGRIDAGLVLSTGEKTNPDPMLDCIRKCKLVDEAIMFGQARTHNGVLIQLAAHVQVDGKDDAQLAKFRNQIWPFVEEANAIAPTHSAM